MEDDNFSSIRVNCYFFYLFLLKWIDLIPFDDIRLEVE